MKTKLSLVVLCSVAVLCAQGTVTIASNSVEQKKDGSIVGTVIDIVERSPIENATVEILGSGQKVVTSKDGQFKIMNLGEGFYQVRASAGGYDQQTQNNLYADGSKPVAAFFMLKRTGSADDRNTGSSTPVPISTKSPVYPEEARKNGIEGVFYFVLKISESGAIQTVKCYERNVFADNGKLKDQQVMEKYSQFVNQLEKEATDAVWQWKFNPAMKEGIPIVSEAVLPIKFKLDPAEKEAKKEKKK